MKKKKIDKKELSEKDLDQVVGGAYVHGSSQDDVLVGGSGNDLVYGGDGSDTLVGGEGDDYLDGGFGDGADDVAYGGTGDDTFVWGLTGDGNDTFHGGTGNDTLDLDLETTEFDTIQEAFGADGGWTIELADAEGNPVEITDDMWVDGNLILPEGASGTITGPDGNTMHFDGVEKISTFDGYN